MKNCLTCPNFWKSNIDETACAKCGPKPASTPEYKGKFEKEGK